MAKIFGGGTLTVLRDTQLQPGDKLLVSVHLGGQNWYVCIPGESCRCRFRQIRFRGHEPILTFWDRSLPVPEGRCLHGLGKQP